MSFLVNFTATDAFDKLIWPPGADSLAGATWFPGITYQLVVMTGLAIDMASICGRPQPSPLHNNKGPVQKYQLIEKDTFAMRHTTGTHIMVIASCCHGTCLP